MADKRIIELTNEAMNHSNDDYLAVDSSSSGTRKIKADALLAGVAKQADLAAETAARKQDVADLKADLEELEPGLSDAAKIALLNCFAHVAWVDEHGQDYYSALESELYVVTYPKITARFNPGVNVIYTDDTLDSLKQYLTVTYFEAKESEGTVIDSANYTLSGVLVEGASTMYATYDGLATSFTVDGVIDFYNQHSVITTLASAGNIYKNGSLNVIMSDTSSLARATIGLSKGRQPIYKKSPYEGLFYPIPIPSDAVSVTVECASTLQPNIASWQWNGSNYGDQILNTGWLSAGGGSATFEAIENGFVTVVFKKTDSSNFADADLPVNVSIVFE